MGTQVTVLEHGEGTGHSTTLAVAGSVSQHILDGIFNATRITEHSILIFPAAAMVMSMTYRALVRFPLAYFYLYGPRMQTLGLDVGGWSGMEPADICGQLTNVPSSHWAQELDQCVQLINRSIHSMEVSVGGAIYILLLLQLIRFIPSILGLGLHLARSLLALMRSRFASTP